MSSACRIAEHLLTPQTITSMLSILLFISETLPYIKSMKANGIVQSIHMYIFHRNDDEDDTQGVHNRYGSI